MALPSVLALTLSPLWPAWCAFVTLLTPHFWLGVAAAVLLVRAAEARARTRAARSAAVPVLAECTPPTLKQLKLSASLGDVPSWVSYPDFERTNWINQLLKKMWPFIAAYVGDMILESVNPMIEYYRPPSIKTMKLSVADLGTVPPVLAGVKVESTPSQDEALLLTDLKWAGDPNIKLVIKLPPPIGNLTIAVADLQVFCKVRFVLKPMMPTAPLVGCVGVSLVGPPTIDFALRVAGGDVMAIPGVTSSVRGMVKSMLEDWMIWPNVMQCPMVSDIDLAKLRAGYTDGMLFVKVKRAYNLPRLSFIEKIDPYVVAWTRARRKISTDAKSDDLEPEWDEMLQMVVTNAEADVLNLELWDDEKIGPSRLVGKAEVPVHTFGPMEVVERKIKLSLTDRFNRGKATNNSARPSGLDPTLVIEALYVPLSAADDAEEPAPEAAVEPPVAGTTGAAKGETVDTETPTPGPGALTTALLALASDGLTGVAGKLARAADMNAEAKILETALSRHSSLGGDVSAAVVAAVATVTGAELPAPAPAEATGDGGELVASPAPRKPRLDLPDDWTLPPSGILTVTVHSLINLDAVKSTKKLHAVLTLGGKSRSTKNCVPVANDDGTFHIEEEVYFIGVDPNDSPTLRIDVLKNKHLSSKMHLGARAFRKIATANVSIAPFDDLERSRLTEQYHLETIRTGIISLTLNWESSASSKSGQSVSVK
eukprot:PRCOL_00003719-RA